MAEEPPPGVTRRPYGAPHDTPPPAARPYAQPADGHETRPPMQPPPGGWPPPPGGWPPPPGGWPPPPEYGPPGRPPWEQGAPPPPPRDPVLDEQARRAGRHAVVYATVGFVLPFILVPLGAVYLPIAVAVDAAAMVLAVRARRAATKANRSPGAAITAIVMASVALALAVAIGAVTAIFWDEFRSYQDCNEGANTHAAQATCQHQLSDDVMRRLGL